MEHTNAISGGTVKYIGCFPDAHGWSLLPKPVSGYGSTVTAETWIDAPEWTVRDPPWQGVRVQRME